LRPSFDPSGTPLTPGRTSSRRGLPPARLPGASRAPEAAAARTMSGRLHTWLGEHFSPLVLVIASPDAEALCARNGLSVVDLLAPHCSVKPNGACLAAPAPRCSAAPRVRTSSRALRGAAAAAVAPRCPRRRLRALLHRLWP
jgi:hypothetical protein